MKREYLNKRDKDQMIASNGTIRKPVEIYQYTAGDNVAISDDHVISAVDTTYTAGQNVQISDDNVISATDTTYTAGQNIQISGDNVISATDTTYTAGQNITISADNVISATGGGGGDEFVFTLTPYSLSDGMRIENSSDKTASEIISAYNNGKTIIGVMKFNQQEYFFSLISNVAGAPVTKITLSGFNSDRTLPSFFELAIDSGNGAIQIGWAPDSFKGRICRYGDLATTIASGLNNPPTTGAVYSAIQNIPTYTLPTASANDLGGVKVGSGLSIDGNGVLSASGGGGGGSSTNYSTTEQEIGTWIDGSTLYSIVAPNVSVDMGGSTGDISSTPQNLKSYTAVTAGNYVFTSMTGNTNCGNNEGFIGFYKNGVQIATRQLPTGQTVSLADVDVSLEVGDVVATKFEFVGSHTCRATLTASLLPTVASGASIKFKKTTVDTLYNYFEYTKPSI